MKNMRTDREPIKRTTQKSFFIPGEGHRIWAQEPDDLEGVADSILDDCCQGRVENQRTALDRAEELYDTAAALREFRAG